MTQDTPDISSLQYGHRERMRQKFLDEKITDYETFELLLGYVIPRRDVRALSRGMMCRFGDMHQLLSAPIDDLMAYPGIGRNTAIFLKVVHSILALELRDKLRKGPIFQSDETLRMYCRLELSGKDTEEIHLLYLGPDCRLIEHEVHTRGTLDSALAFPREIAKRALLKNAKYLVMAHNHPTGTAQFSEPDIEMTSAVDFALQSVESMLYDHLLVAGNVVLSGLDLGMLKHKIRLKQFRNIANGG